MVGVTIWHCLKPGEPVTAESEGKVQVGAEEDQMLI